MKEKRSGRKHQFIIEGNETRLKDIAFLQTDDVTSFDD